MRKKDVLTKQQRSYCMSRIKSKDTKVEVLVRSTLFKKGYRFRKHTSSLPGRPDIIFVSKKVIVFIDGDFWHGRHHTKWLPEMTDFWRTKIGDNILRDKRNFRKLRSLGWKVLRIWESDAYKDLGKQISRIENLLEQA